MTDVHFTCNLIDVNCPVVPDTLIDLLLNLNTRYIRRLPRARIISSRSTPQNSVTHTFLQRICSPPY